MTKAGRLGLADFSDEMTTAPRASEISVTSNPFHHSISAT